MSAFATIILLLWLWELLNLATSNQSGYITLAIVRLVIPLSLVFAIWRGRTWARFVLAAYCGWVLYANFYLIAQVSKMYANRDYEALGLLASYILGYGLIALLAITSNRLSGLIAYRCDDTELD